MRYCFFSDVHSNLEAFEAVLHIIDHSKIDSYFFAGDIVGYGADPSACITLLRNLNPVMVAGNHDWAAVDLVDKARFNEAAKKAIFWTSDVLTEDDKLFLCGLKLVVESKKFCIVHGTLTSPQEFDYMFGLSRAAKTFNILKQNICLVGHSHYPGVFVEDKEGVKYLSFKKIKLQEGLRYIINCGSVGQPRDGDPRACFCIYDDDSYQLEFHRVEYDVAKTQKKILRAGLPSALSDRLSLGL